MKIFARRRFLGLLVLVVPLACVLSYAVGQQWFFRWRLERLLADVKLLEVPKSSWPDFQRFMTRWGKWGFYQGTCDANHCAYRVILGDQFLQRWYPSGESPRHEWARWALNAVGVRPAGAFVDVEVLSNRVVSKGFGLMINQPFGSHYEELFAHSYEGSRLPHYRDFVLLHPNRYLESGQRGYFMLSFTPSEASDEKNRLTHFRFNCITKLFPCSKSEDFLPDAYAEYKQQSSQVSREMDSVCGEPLWVAARDATGVFVADVVSAKRVTAYDDGTPADTY